MLGSNGTLLMRISRFYAHNGTTCILFDSQTYRNDFWLKYFYEGALWVALSVHTDKRESFVCMLCIEFNIRCTYATDWYNLCVQCTNMNSSICTNVVVSVCIHTNIFIKRKPPSSLYFALAISYHLKNILRHAWNEKTLRRSLDFLFRVIWHYEILVWWAIESSMPRRFHIFFFHAFSNYVALLLPI